MASSVRLALHFLDDLVGQAVGRQGAGAVARMDAGFLDMLHHPGDHHIGAVAQRIDIAFDRVAQILVDQHRAVARHVDRGVDVIVELGLGIDDLHRPSAEHVARPHQHRVADAVGHRDRLVAAAGDAVLGLLELELVDQLGEALAVFGQVDRIGRSAEDRDPGIFQRLRQLERRLPAELDDHAHQRAVLLLDPQDFEHVLGGQRLEIEPVGGVVIGRNGLRVAVYHDGFKAIFGQREAGVAAAIVELDPLPDAVRPAAQDHDLLPVRRLRLVLGLAEARGFVGRIHVGRDRLELGGAAVDPLEHRIDAELVAQLAHFLLAGRAGHRAGPRRAAGPSASPGSRPARPRHGPTARPASPGACRKAHRLEPAQSRGIVRQAVGGDPLLLGDDLGDVAQEPRIEMGDRVDFLDREAFAEGLRDLEDTVGRLARKRGGDLVALGAFELEHAVEPVEPGFEPAQRLLHAFLEAAADRHHFADRFHRGRQCGLARP